MEEPILLNETILTQTILKEGDKSQPLEEISELDLSHKNIESIESSTFSKCTSLTKLWIQENKLKRLEADTFKLTRLTILWLSKNELASIEPTTFDSLTSLAGLWLNSNQLKHIDSHVFSKLVSLSELELRNNQIEYIDKDAFASLVNLTGLWLSNNRLTSIEPSTFDSVYKLTELKLSSNMLSEIKANAFEKLANLTVLWLDDNKLTNIEPDAFYNLKSLECLYLEKNQLSKLDPHLFSRCTNLKVIHLYENKFEEEKDLDLSLFRGLFYLTTLKIRDMFTNSLGKIMLEIREENPDESDLIEGLITKEMNDFLNSKNLKVVKQLGSGTFGNVYFIRNANRAKFTIKQMRIMKCAKGKKRIESYLKDLAELNHPNIAKYYDGMVKDSCLVFRCEYFDEASLAQSIKTMKQANMKFRMKSVFMWVHDLLSALNYLHHDQRKPIIIHGNIKPSNIFFDKTRSLKLGDFNLTPLIHVEESDHTRWSTTNCYMSPELIHRNEPTTKSDIWAAGCVVYEMLKLERLFDEEERWNVSSKICLFDQVALRMSLKGENQFIIWAILNMLRRDPNERPEAKTVFQPFKDIYA